MYGLAQASLLSRFTFIIEKNRGDLQRQQKMSAAKPRVKPYATANTKPLAHETRT